MKIFTVIINGIEGVEVYDFDQAVSEAYEKIAQKFRDEETSHCIAELEQSRKTSYGSLSVSIRETES